MSRASRWPGDDTPLTGVHGGSKAAAERAIAETKVLRAHDRAVQARLEKQMRAVDAAGATVATFKRKDRLRPRAKGPSLIPKLIQKIADIQGGRCVHCGGALDHSLSRFNPLRPTYEHVIPRARGGKNVGNRLVAHLVCNGEKGDSMPTGCELVWLLAVNARLGVEPTRF
jgi:hypothetical protein